MGDYLATQADWIATGRKHAQSERGAGKNVGGALVAQRRAGGTVGLRGRSIAALREQNPGVASPSEFPEGVVRWNWPRDWRKKEEQN
jgi:hypothetical protein